MLGCAHRRFGEDHQLGNRVASFVRACGFHYLVITSFEHEADLICLYFVLDGFSFVLCVEGLCRVLLFFEMLLVCPLSPLSDFLFNVWSP